MAYIEDMSNEEIAKCWSMLKAIAELRLFYGLEADDLVNLMDTIEGQMT